MLRIVYKVLYKAFELRCLYRPPVTAELLRGKDGVTPTCTFFSSVQPRTTVTMLPAGTVKRATAVALAAIDICIVVLP